MTFRRLFPAAMIAAATVATAAALLSACAHASKLTPPADAAAYATQVASAAGAFRVAYEPQPAPVPVNRLHAWKLHIANADGSPVTDAQVQVDGDMPQHGHGLPTQPRVTSNLGGGDYLLEGVKFQMPGWWVMDFRIRSGARTDTARFNLNLALRG